MADLRADMAWDRQVLTNSDDQLILAAFGLKCSLGELYKGTFAQRP